LAAVRACPERLAAFSPALDTERRQTKDFLYEKLYFSDALRPEKSEAEQVVTELFQYWMEHPETLPASYQEQAQREPLHRVVCDYIAGMTDTFILRQHRKLVATA
jgi:dGTPase